MYPLEFVDLPKKSDIWIMYINGEHCRNVDKPYIENGIIYFPYDVVCEKLHCEKVVDAEYIDADALVKYHKVSLTWEQEALAIYITSVLHYDGYRCFDDVIENSVNSLEFLGRYCYIDAIVEDITETNVVIKKHATDIAVINLKKSNHHSAEGTSNVAISIGGTYRFCFELLAINKNSFSGRLMETADIPNINTQYGFMKYRIQDWKKIEKWIREHEQVDSREHLQIYYVLAHSGGMYGIKIASLNTLFERLTNKVLEISKIKDIGIDISTLAYASGCDWIGDKHLKITDYQWQDIEACGMNEFGGGLKLLDDELWRFHTNKDKYKPIIIFGQNESSTDNYSPMLDRISKNPVFNKALRIVIPFSSAYWTDEDIVKTLKGDKGLLLVGEEYEKDEVYTPYDDIDMILEQIYKAILAHIKENSYITEIDEKQKKIIDMLIHYKTSIESAKKLKAFLLDWIPEERAIRNVLVAAYSEGIIEEISKNQDITMLKNRFCKNLINNYGFGEQIVIWAFDTWKFYCESENGICR